jgi:nucleolar complex protein 3
MAEASALVNTEEREKMQSETLKLVFATYFRILKARAPALMGSVLEGLARYAHLINQDLFGDLLEALKEIVAQADEAIKSESDLDDEDDGVAESDEKTLRNLTRESLLATQTAFTLLSGQDVSKAAASSLNLDLSFFSAHTYRSLYPLCVSADIELGPKSLHLADPHSSHNSSKNGALTGQKINISTPILLLTRVLTSILLTPSSPPPTITTLAFFKRLLSISLHLPEKSTVATLSLLHRIADKHGKKVEALWYSDERKGEGVFKPQSETVEGSNVLSLGAGVWEVEVLKRHFCPGVREAVGKIEGVVGGLRR